ncbi:MAG: HAMP domain-containing histidine kinase [Desulfohalobiaceae bacterium]|nr:HAMP domain-containing histidine kinase [Desulfohalobiaceae bacterium]
MSSIIEHVRLFAREAGQPEVTSSHVNEVLQSSLQMLDQQFQAHGYVITVDLAPDLPSVCVNPFSLEEVFLNLLFNARDAMDEGRARGGDLPEEINIRSFLAQKGDATWIQVQISDQGTGISEADKTRIFEPFFTTKEQHKGTGLGLSICRSIISEFGGTIDLQSTSGQGTTVTVSLPPESSRQEEKA